MRVVDIIMTTMDSSSDSDEESRKKRRKKEPSEAEPAKEIFYLSFEKGEPKADFEKQLRLEGEINSIL